MAGPTSTILEASFNTSLQTTGAIGGVILLIMLLAAWLVDRDITGSLGGCAGRWIGWANGDLATAVTGVDRRDEVGDMAPQCGCSRAI